LGKKAAFKALANSDVSKLLSIVLDRLYVMRNQIIHGGATYQSQVNREQLRSARRMLSELLPVVIALMVSHPDDWGTISYPVVEA